MKKIYRTIDDVLRSPWVAMQPAERASVLTDRVLRSTKLEDSIYADLRDGDEALDAIEQSAGEKLRSFPALSRDVYQSFYSLMPKRREETELSTEARTFNANILDHITGSEDYPTLKNICEGRELPAYEAAAEFISRTAGELDRLLGRLGGEKSALQTLEKLELAQQQAQNNLAALLERMRKSKGQNAALEQAVLAAASSAESKRRQVEAVGKLVDAAAAKNKEAVRALVQQAVSSATEKAKEVQGVLSAWGNDTGSMEKNAVNTELLSLVRQSKELRDISQYLGRFRDIFAQGKHNGYAYGRGEKYSLELGRDLSRAITSELAMLAAPETAPLFLQKYQRRQLKQYRRREPIYKGAGDMICCLDESGSTCGDAAAWGKAVALTLLETAADGGRKFALVHFSGTGSIQTNLFLPRQYGVEDKLCAAETFLGGGTDFETPLREAVRLMDAEGFENADVVFITDGICNLPEDYLETLRAEQAKRRFTVTGVLLDSGSPGMEFSLKAFCRNLYRTSELLGDEIVRELVKKRV